MTDNPEKFQEITLSEKILIQNVLGIHKDDMKVATLLKIMEICFFIRTNFIRTKKLV